MLARLFVIETPLPALKTELREIAARIATPIRPGDYAQAMMDLGATICTPRTPNCRECPWRGACRAHKLGLEQSLPRRAPRPERPLRHAAAFVITDPHGDLLLERRSGEGLLGGLIQVPLTPWLDQPPVVETISAVAPFKGEWDLMPGIVRHGFTHFAVRISVFVARASPHRRRTLAGFWCAPDRLGDHALSTMVKKIIRHAADNGVLGGPPKLP